MATLEIRYASGLIRVIEEHVEGGALDLRGGIALYSRGGGGSLVRDDRGGVPAAWLSFGRVEIGDPVEVEGRIDYDYADTSWAIEVMAQADGILQITLNGSLVWAAADNDS